MTALGDIPAAYVASTSSTPLYSLDGDDDQPQGAFARFVDELRDVLAQRAAIRNALERIGVRDPSAIELVQVDLLPAGFAWCGRRPLGRSPEQVVSVYQAARDSLWWSPSSGLPVRPPLRLCAGPMLELARALGDRPDIVEAIRDVERFDLAHIAVRHGRAVLNTDTGNIEPIAPSRGRRLAR